MNEKLKPLVTSLEIGLISLGLSACTVPPSTEAYYNPWSDEIIYLDKNPDRKILIHEQVHKDQANNYPEGRILWGIRYGLDPVFACAEETEANKKSMITLTHPACRGIDK